MAAATAAFVIVGTGSAGIAVVEGRVIKVGGYGFPISDEGSGADLGLQAIRMALRAHDGRTPATDFTREVMARFGDDPFEAVAWMDRATATDYATFAPLVMRCANDGDPVAAGSSARPPTRSAKSCTVWSRLGRPASRWWADLPRTSSRGLPRMRSACCRRVRAMLWTAR
jgi:hypothetical protein